MKYKGLLRELSKQREFSIAQLERIDKAIAAVAGLSGETKSKAVGRRKPKFSKAGLARIAAAQRARWAKIKASKK